MTDMNIALAFVAGVLSFLSPCVLALAPGYVFMITAMTGGDNATPATAGRAALVGSLFYTLGFSCVFISFGAAASGLGHFMRDNRELLMRVSGLLVVVFGLHTAGFLRIGLLNRQQTPLMGAKRQGLGGCFMTGVAFAFGWSPCVGPILGTILTIAGGTGDVARGILLLTSYSLGLSLPFVLLAISIGRSRPLVNRILRSSDVIEKVSGIFLVLVGLVMASGKFYLISSRLLALGGSWSPDDIAESIYGFFGGLFR